MFGETRLWEIGLDLLDIHTFEQLQKKWLNLLFCADTQDTVVAKTICKLNKFGEITLKHVKSGHSCANINVCTHLVV